MQYFHLCAVKYLLNFIRQPIQVRDSFFWGGAMGPAKKGRGFSPYPMALRKIHFLKIKNKKRFFQYLISSNLPAPCTKIRSLAPKLFDDNLY